MIQTVLKSRSLNFLGLHILLGGLFVVLFLRLVLFCFFLLFLIFLFIFVVFFILLLFLFRFLAWMGARVKEVMCWNDWAHVMVFSWTSVSSLIDLLTEEISETAKDGS